MYQNYLLLLLFVFTILVITKPLGIYIFKVYNNEKTWLDWFARPLECVYIKFIGGNTKQEQTAKEYFKSLISFSVVSLLLVLFVLIYQNSLPFNPEHITILLSLLTQFIIKS